MTVTKRTVKKLWFASGNSCAHPDCDHDLIDFDDDTVVGEMCHIRARSPNGPRYDPEMTDEERDAYSNLLLLCPTHHTIVDEAPEKYPPEKLESWKEQHEQQSGETPEPSPELLEELLDEVRPTMLLAHVEENDLAVLRDVLDWTPEVTYAEDEHGLCPIVLTFDDLKQLLGRAALPYRQKMNGRPLYEQSFDWSEDEVIAASATAAHVAKLCIQYYQVEGSRRESELVGLDRGD